MNRIHTEAQSDIWSDWLLHRRHADNAEYDEVVRSVTERYADRVIDGAQLDCGMTLVDIGAGDGLVAFRAIDRIGASLKVLLTDISSPMLRHAEGLAIERGVRRQCTFVECSAERLKGISDGSVDAVTTRSALAYVPDKRAALREFYRILKPGGRLSIAEPIFQDDALATKDLRSKLDVVASDSRDSFLPLLHRWKAAQYPDTDETIQTSAIANYSERDLLRFAQDSGFSEIHVELHMNVSTSIFNSWEVFLGISPHPLAPTLHTILANQFSEDERQLFEKTLRPIVEDPESVSTDRMAYVTARKSLK